MAASCRVIGRPSYRRKRIQLLREAWRSELKVGYLSCTRIPTGQAGVAALQPGQAERAAARALPEARVARRRILALATLAGELAGGADGGWMKPMAIRCCSITSPIRRQQRGHVAAADPLAAARIEHRLQFLDH